MRTHHLKIWPEYFAAVECGSKTFEFRKNDRNFHFGDNIVLQEWDPTRDYNDDLVTLKPPRGYTGRELRRKIGYILEVEGLAEEDFNYVILSLLPYEEGK